MTLISLDLNQARSTASTFQSSGNALDDLCGQLQSQWARLAANWEGDSKHHIADDVQNALNWNARAAQHTTERGVKLTQIANRFEAADESVPHEVIPIQWSISIALSLSPGIVAALSGLPGTSFDILKLSGDILEELGKLGKSANAILGFGLGLTEDFANNTYKGDIPKTVGVNLIDTGLNLVIGATGVGEVVLLANGAVQVAGDLQVGMQRTISDWISVDKETQDVLLRDADRVEDAVQRTDLGNVTKSLSEGIYDSYFSPYIDIAQADLQALQDIAKDPSFENILQVSQSLSGVMQEKTPRLLLNAGLGPAGALLFTPEGQQGLENTLKSVGNVLDGAVDWSVSTTASRVNQSIASTTKLIDSLPVSDVVKSAANDVSKVILNATEQVTDSIVNFIKIQ